MRRSTMRGSLQSLLALALGLAVQTAPFAAGPPPLYIATPIGSPLVAHNHATAINAGGQLAGWAWAIDFTFKHAWVEQAGILKDIGTLGGRLATGRAVNASGHVVGESTLATGSLRHAFVYRDGAMTDLNTYLPPAMARTLTLVKADRINDQGSIAADAVDKKGVHHAVLLTAGQ